MFDDEYFSQDRGTSRKDRWDGAGILFVVDLGWLG